MDVTAKLRRSLRLQNTAFVVLFLAAVGLVAGLSAVYTYEADWTAGNRNTLSEASRELLARAEAPITITAYATEDARLREQIRRFVGRYQRADAAEVRLRFVNPDARPSQVRELGIRRNGQLAVSYQGRTEKAEQRSEQAVSQALQRLLRSGERQVYFLAGHGERALEGRGRSALGRFVQALEGTGAQVDPLNLAERPQIPAATDLLVIGGAQQPLLEAEVEQLRGYVAQGGNLLWLADEGAAEGLQPLAEALGVELSGEGVAVDPRTRVFGLQDPTQVLVSSYPDHPALQGLDSITLFPGAARVQASPPAGWQAEPLVQTSPEAWLETGSLEGTVRFDAGKDREGPVTLALALTRAEVPAGEAGAQPQAAGGEAQGSASQGEGGSGGAVSSPQKEAAAKPGGAAAGQGGGSGDAPAQKVVVVGDGDFLANAYLGSGANRKLGLGLFQWLSSDEGFVTIPAPAAPDQHLSLPGAVAWLMPALFLGGLPLAFLLAGGAVWLRRRRL
ncbi:GldG family protein [Halorhodospira neutriphila]|uniref:ABC transporter n=1 Tax=Halorhodospira neutriphila TaxID=168379 RepID=A0ABS1E784_9GAMM|nr:GldG family protein [Halorhodospira neutriphila]MBK1726823.1 hypothetical protein [Halorhodospira neutriphila]